MPSKERTVKKAEWRQPGGLFQGSFNSSLTRKSLWCAARFCSLWLWAGVISKWGERGGMRVRSMWLRNESPKKFWLFLPPACSTGTLSQQLFKVLCYFSPWCLFFIFILVNVESYCFCRRALNKLTVFWKVQTDTHSAGLRRHRSRFKVVFCCFASGLAWIQLTWLLIVIKSHI